MTQLTLRLPGLDPQTAYSAGMLADLAYCRNGALKTNHKLRNWGFPEVEWFVRGAAMAFVADREDVTVVAFAGTNDIGDWNTNRQVFLSVPGPFHGSDRVHRGFSAYLDLVWRELNDHVKHVTDGYKKRILVVGHSLGGAAATQAAARFNVSGAELDHRFKSWINPDITVYTFGEPRSGNALFAKLYNGYILHHYRFTANNDPVPWVPLPWLPWSWYRYRHVGHHLHFNADRSLAFRPKLAPLLWDAFGGLMQGSVGWLWSGVKSHLMSAYLPRLAAAIEERRESE